MINFVFFLSRVSFNYNAKKLCEIVSHKVQEPSAHRISSFNIQFAFYSLRTKLQEMEHKLGELDFDVNAVIISVCSFYWYYR